MRARPLYPEVFLLSLAVILLEVAYTRIFSFKLVYYFTYLIIGLALLGLGSGGVLVALVPRLRRRVGSGLVPACALVAGGAVLGGYLVVARTRLNAFEMVERLVPLVLPVVVREGAKLLLVCGCVFTPFLAAGVAIAAIFATRPDRFSRLYLADLLGAGLGCAAVIPLVTLISPPGCVLLAGLVATLAGVRLATRHARLLLVPMAAISAPLLLGAVFPGRLPDPVPDRVKGLGGRAGPPTILFSRWSPVFRIDVVPSPTSDARRVIYHDAMLGSVLNRFDGNPASLARFDHDQRAYPFRLLGPAPRVAIIGAAGGNEILASLYFNAAHVTAVELNPATVSLLTNVYADYSGHLADNERVTLINGEGRSFLGSDHGTYDLIWFVAPDSYAAMNAATSGAYVLSESYLYTREMISEALDHLPDDGLVCAQFGEVEFDLKPNRTARYLATARDAFRRRGVEDFGAHVLVATRRGLFTTSTILLRKTPFSADEAERFRRALEASDGTVRFAPGLGGDGQHPVTKVITLPGRDLERWFGEYPFDVRPVMDDAPFFWHFVPFRDAVGRLITADAPPQMEEAVGELLLLVLLVVATAFAAALLLLPLLARREVWRRVPHKAPAAVFFAAIGTGFMFLEVTLIQRLTLFLGYPTYSLTVTLFALLVSTGAGSALSERYASRRDAALLALAGLLVGLVLFYFAGLAAITARAAGAPFAARVALASAIIAPLGLCLGAFMPLGLRTVAALGEHGEEYVAWSWAVNGFFSVVSSVLATILAMALGFNAVLLSALGVYLVGIAALLRIPAPEAVRP
jgi:hypothetical protein